MTYTLMMLESEKQAFLSGETRGEWYQYLTSYGVGEIEGDEDA